MSWAHSVQSALCEKTHGCLSVYTFGVIQVRTRVKPISWLYLCVKIASCNESCHIWWGFVKLSENNCVNSYWVGPWNNCHNYQLMFQRIFNQFLARKNQGGSNWTSHVNRGVIAQVWGWHVFLWGLHQNYQQSSKCIHQMHQNCVMHRHQWSAAKTVWIWTNLVFLLSFLFSARK